MTTITPKVFRKRDPLAARTQPPPPSVRAFCGKCGREGGLICAGCAAERRAWVAWNTTQGGGREGQ